jgi:tetratricopeptide (TPR) repeat protein
MYWQLLGLAEYRAGQWQSAVDSLQKAIQISPEGDALAAFYLAVAYQELDDPDAAKRWYEVGLTKSGQPSSTRLDSIQAAREECESVLAR